jgi:phosphoenolpyruvate-protein phosphotransferase
MSEGAKNLKLKGRSICAGLAIGQAFVYRERAEEVLAESYWIEAHEVEEELRRIERAAERVAEDLRVSARRVEGDTRSGLAGIFEAHATMLQDPALHDEIRSIVQEERVRAEHALARVFRHREKQFRELARQGGAQHADDVADLARRMLRQMAGVKVTPLERMPPGRVLVASRLLPSDTVALPARSVAGIVAEFGGSGSHVALLAEALGIPTVAQLPGIAAIVEDRDTLLVDGVNGEVVINPDAATREEHGKLSETTRARRERLRDKACEPARTRAGVPVAVMANVSRREDTAAAVENGADGIGLCRLEGYYMARKTPPTAGELLTELQSMFAPMTGKQLTIRLLDVGGDKQLPYLRMSEHNPFLGLRGVRFLLHYPDLLIPQLEALCQLSRDYELRVLVPMVTFAEEVEQIGVKLRNTAKAAGCTRVPPLGAMIETPAAVLGVSEILEHADFLSIGTNDLTQYTFAAGRENPLVSDYYRENHPVLQRLLRMVMEASAGKEVAVCGELARQPDAVPALLGMGIRTLSVPAPLVPDVKEMVREAT